MTASEKNPVEAQPESTGADEPQSVDPARKAEMDALAAELAAGAPAAKKPVRKSRRVTVKDPSAVAVDEAPAPATDEAQPAAEAEEAAAPVKRKTSTRATSKRTPKAAAEPEASTEESPAADAAPVSDRVTEGDDSTTETPAADSAASEDGESSDADAGDADAAEGSGRSRSRRGRSRSRGGNGQQTDGQPAPAADGDEDRQAQGRARERGRKRGGGRLGDDLEPEILPDDVLLPIAGILDVLDNYAFVRTTGYLAGVTDVYVSLGQVKKYGLRKGDAVVGAIRQPREGEQQGRQKYNALVKIDAVNGLNAEASIARPEFAAFTPLQPAERLTATTAKGQRALVLGGTGAGKSKSIATLAAEVSEVQPESHLMVILVAPRPEEVTDFRRSVKGEVVVSGLEQSAEDHITVVELAVERAKRLVELGIDVVILIDSITQLARAYAAHSGPRAAHEDPSVALPVKRLFGAARETEESASLTMVATASADTAFDQFVVAELGSLANQTIQL